MARLILLVSLCLCGQASLARCNERPLDWHGLREQGCITQGVIVPAEGPAAFDSLRVANTGSEPSTIQVLVLEDPPVTARRFSLTGTLRYEEISGRGSLELWAHFPGGQVASASTQASAGPSRYLEGTSEWREFVLLIDAPAAWGRPGRLVLNVSLPGPGTVWLGPLSLVGHPMGWRALLSLYGWWIVGGVWAAALLATEAFLLGLAGRGRARAAVTVGLIAAFLCGAAMFVGGVVAAARLQPTFLSASAVLAGLVVATIAGLGLLRARRLYGEQELRKIDAMDAV
jgi:hypothetical protein